MLSDHLPFDTKHLCREGGQVGKEWIIHKFENINTNFENNFDNIIEKNLDNIPEHQETVLAAYDDFPLVDCRA